MFNSSFAFANIHGPWNNTPMFPPQGKKQTELCSKCDNEAQPDTDPLLCVDCMAQKGGGNDPETADEEMKAMEARNVNEDEGDK